MKLLIFCCLFSLNTFAGYKEVKTFSNSDFQDLTQDMERNLLEVNMGDSFNFRMVIDSEVPAEEINTLLIDKYIDDIDVIETTVDDDAMEAAIFSLNYRNIQTEEAQEVLLTVEIMAHLYMDIVPGARFFSLKSRGYGSFGQANGFALFFPETNEIMILTNGYAE